MQTHYFFRKFTLLIMAAAFVFAASACEAAIIAKGAGTVNVIFNIANLPKSVEEFTAMPEFDFATPEQTAALYVVAISIYKENPENCYAMLDALKGPQPLNHRERDFIRDRMRNKADYIGKAYFTGATPANNYTPTIPYTVAVTENAYTYQSPGYATVYIKTAGADSPRPVQLRQKGNEWFLWEFFGTLSDIRVPAAQNPWG